MKTEIFIYFICVFGLFLVFILSTVSKGKKITFIFLNVFFLYVLGVVEIVIYALCAFSGVLFVDDVLHGVLNKMTTESSKDDYKWIRREFRLLEALYKDYRSILYSVDQLKQRANQVWDSELGVAGISLRLDETQTKWLRRAGIVVRDTKVLEVINNENLILKSLSEVESLERRGMVFISLIRAMKTTHKLKQAKKAITDHFQNNDDIFVHNICQSLELSSIKVRSLQEEAMDENVNRYSISSRPQFRSGAALLSNVKRLMALRPNLIVWSIKMQLLLLHAFMKDLRGLRLESEIQNTWINEAQRIITETEEAIDTFFLNTATRTRWLSVLDNWKAKHKLKENIKHADRQLSELLQAKERYGFKFIIREASKSANPHQNPLQPSTDDTVVSSAVDSIDRLLNQPGQETVSAQVRDHFSSLRDQLKRTQKLLKDEKSIEGAPNTRTACFEQLQKMAFDAEFSARTRREHSRVFLTFLFRSKLVSKILRIKQAADLLQRSIKVYRIEMVKNSISIVGLEEDIHSLVSKLTTNIGAHESIVSIVGMKGIGKTPLAKKIFNHRSVVNHFDVRRWFNLPQEIDQNSALVRNIEVVMKTRGKRLVVLANLHSKEGWDVLKPILMLRDIRDGLKIVITTRRKEVASHVDTSSIHQIRLRTKAESWEFFTQMVYIPSHVETLAKKVVGRTGGLPLTILYLGYLFYGKEVTAEELTRVLERVTQGQNQTPWLDAWDINKEDLQSQTILGKCLSYFESFPVDFEIPARRLVALWVARGLAQAEDTNISAQQYYGDEERTHENVAYSYLSELINRNMIQVVERKLKGKVKTCRFPSPLRELWSQRRGNNRTIRSWSLITTSEGQLAYHFEDINASYSHRIHGLRTSSSSFLPEERYPRSIMFFDTREGSKPGEDIGNFLLKGIKSRRFEGLLVLDLEGVFRPHLPSNIGTLKQLTYLGLRWTYLETIPSSIGKLLNLQTLDVKYTYIRTLPISIWELRKLRHLYLNEYCRIKFMPKPSAMSMRDDLQTLNGVFLDEDSPLKDGLDKLHNLRKLGIAFQLTLPQQVVLARLIAQLTHLKSLSLSSINEKSEPQDLKVEPLSGLHQLYSLYLFGKLEITSNITSELPESLTELILSASQLPEDPMPSLGKLPKLKSLSFFSDSFKGEAMVCCNQSFPQLLVLKLWSLDSLERLAVEQGAMQNLREMEIRSCRNLIVTTGLTHLKTLQQLTLTNMPNEYGTHIRNGFAAAREQSPGKIIHSPKIKIDNL